MRGFLNYPKLMSPRLLNHATRRIKYSYLCVPGMPTHSRIAYLLTKTFKNALPGMPKIALAFFLVAGILFSPAFDAQSGGRKKEGRIKRKGDFKLTQYKSRGHADEFARGSSGRKGWIARLFKRDKPAWTYRTTGSNRSNYK